jgi:hypothetical protein
METYTTNPTMCVASIQVLRDWSKEMAKLTIRFRSALIELEEEILSKRSVISQQEMQVIICW